MGSNGIERRGADTWDFKCDEPLEFQLHINGKKGKFFASGKWSIHPVLSWQPSVGPKLVVTGDPSHIEFMSEGGKRGQLRAPQSCPHGAPLAHCSTPPPSH